MASVLVTGGTGMLGRHLVPALVERGHDVRVLTRRSPADRATPRLVRGDVVTGEGVVPAVAGVDVVIHAATSPTRRARATEVVGTRTMLDAAEREGAHFVYVSIVGVDRTRLPTTKRSGTRNSWSRRAARSGRSNGQPRSTICSTSS